VLFDISRELSICIIEKRRDSVGRIYLSRHRVKWQYLWNVVMSLLVLNEAGKFRIKQLKDYKVSKNSIPLN
jgi:hypothetical protein